MAKMGFREPNKVRWFGIRPGHRGEQVLIGINITADTQVLIDGTQTTITYLTDWCISVGRNKDATGTLEITENDDDHVCYLSQVSGYTSDPGYTVCQGLMYPIEIPAGYKVKAHSSAAAAPARGYIHGWEE